MKTVTKELYDTLCGLTTSILDENGHELLNPTPMELKVGMRKPESLQDKVRRIMRTELSLQAQDQGDESWEEANDFDIEDDESLDITQYTVLEDELPLMKEEPLRVAPDEEAPPTVDKPKEEPQPPPEKNSSDGA